MKKLFLLLSSVLIISACEPYSCVEKDDEEEKSVFSYDEQREIRDIVKETMDRRDWRLFLSSLEDGDKVKYEGLEYVVKDVHWSSSIGWSGAGEEKYYTRYSIELEIDGQSVTKYFNTDDYEEKYHLKIID